MCFSLGFTKCDPTSFSTKYVGYHFICCIRQFVDMKFISWSYFSMYWFDNIMCDLSSSSCILSSRKQILTSFRLCCTKCDRSSFFTKYVAYHITYCIRKFVGMNVISWLDFSIYQFGKIMIDVSFSSCIILARKKTICLIICAVQNVTEPHFSQNM